MSAFIVDDKTINIVVNHLMFHRNDYDWQWRGLATIGIDLQAEGGDIKLAKRMAALNDRAIDARYGEGTAASDRVEPFEYQPFEQADIYQVYKSLSCWLYQCSEGDIPESALYRLFDTDIKPAIADNLISKLPQHKAAAWG